MSTLTISFDFLVCETPSNSFLCKFYYYDSVNFRIKPWTAIQSNKQDALALMQQYSNDLYTALLNIDGITPLGGGSITDYGSFSEMSNSLTIDLSSQSGDIDYTQILTSINSNLASIAANSGSIANKDNQSDIVDCLNNIFCYEKNNSFFSAVKDSSLTSSEWDNTLKSNNIMNMLFNILSMLSNTTLAKNSISSPVSSRVLDNISKKLSNNVPNITDLSQKSILRELSEISRKLSYDYPNSASSDNSLYKQLLNIKASLKESSDLHSISQAIDLISTAIAQTPTTDTSNLEQGLTEIKESIESKDNVLIVDGEQTFKFRDKDS